MVTSNILNQERSKKIKGNGETLVLTLTSWSFSSSLATSLSPQASDSFPRQMFTEVIPCPAGLVFGWVTSKYTPFCRKQRTENSILTLKKMVTTQGADFVSLLYAKQILMQK